MTCDKRPQARLDVFAQAAEELRNRPALAHVDIARIALFVKRAAREITSRVATNETGMVRTPRAVG